MLTDEQVVFITERILSYDGICNLLESKKQELEQIELCGIPGKDKSVTAWSGCGGTSGIDDQLVRESAMIDRLKKEVQRLDLEKRRIECGMETIKIKDKNCIIDMLFFEGKSVAEVAEILGLHRNGLRKQRNALLSEFWESYKNVS